MVFIALRTVAQVHHIGIITVRTYHVDVRFYGNIRRCVAYVHQLFHLRDVILPHHLI